MQYTISVLKSQKKYNFNIYKKCLKLANYYP